MRAIILAGGRGSRLAPWEAPKCLIPVNGLPILYRLLKYLSVYRQIIDDVTVCVGYRGGNVRDAVASWGGYSKFRAQISDAGTTATMAERIRQAIGPDNHRVLICYGDELADVDLAEMYAGHCRRDDLSLTFAAMRAPVPGGTVKYEGGKSPIIVEDDTHLINIGYVIAEPSSFRHLPDVGGLSDWMNAVAKAPGEKTALYLHRGKRASVNSLADLRAAEEVWK